MKSQYFPDLFAVYCFMREGYTASAIINYEVVATDIYDNEKKMDCI